MAECVLQVVAPRPQSFVSGGNKYNWHLAQELHDLGVEVVWCTHTRPHAQWPALWDSLWMDRYLGEFSSPQWVVVHHLQWLWSESPVPRQRECELLARFDGAIVTSPFTREELLRSGLAQPIIVAPPGVEIVRPANWRPQPWPPRLLWIGNLIRRKRLAEWLQLLAVHVDYLAATEVQLFVLGDDSLDVTYAQQCHQLMAQLNANATKPWIHYCGVVSTDRIPQFLAQANLFVSTSAMETWGMAIAEAAAFGLPVWICRGGFADRHLEMGAVGQAFDSPQALTEALLQLDEAALLAWQQSALNAHPNYPSWRCTAQKIKKALLG